LTRIERVASPLPRECSTTELQERCGCIWETNCGVALTLVYKRVHGAHFPQKKCALHFIPQIQPNYDGDALLKIATTTIKPWSG
jgi:hypothetical protein